MKILRLHILNIHSIRRADPIDFSAPPLSDAGIFAITGDTGSGKTTILDALTLALYGQVARNSSPDEIMTYGTAESLAEVEFSTPSGRYLATWAVRRAHNKPHGNLQPVERRLAQWDTDAQQYRPYCSGVRSTLQAVEEVSGLDYDRFTRSVLLAQGQFARFLHASNKDRSDLLERITGTEIYSNLSRAAFERHKEERGRLQQWEATRDNLQLLDPEEATALNNRITELVASLTAAAEQAKLLRQQIEWREKQADLRAQQANLRREQEQLRSQHTDRQQDRHRYEQARSLAPLAPRLRLLEHEHERLQQLLDSQASIQRTLPDYTAQLEQTTRHLNTATDALTLAEQQARARTQLLDQITQLDTRLQDQRQQLAQLQTRQQEGEQEHQRIGERITRLKGEREVTTQKRRTTEQWLTEHQRLATLQRELGQLEQQIEHLEELRQEQHQHRQATDSLQEQLSAAQQQLDAHQLSKHKLDQSLADWEDSFQTAIPSDFSTSPLEAVEHLAKSLQDLRQQHYTLGNLRELSQQYEATLRQQTQLEDRLRSILTEISTLDQQSLYLEEDLQAALQARDDRQELYRRQQLLVNYERDRAQLTEGEPCPLCGAVHHPFRHGQLRPITDLARQDWERADRHWQQLRDQHQSVRDRLGELRGALAQLQGQADQPGQLSEVNRQIGTYEAQMVHLLVGIKERNPAAFAGLEDTVSLQLQAWDKAHHTLQALLKKQQSLRNEVVSLTPILVAAEQEVKILGDKLDQEHRRQEALDQRIGTATEQLTASLAQYGLAYQTGRADELITQLRQAEQQYHQQQQQARTLVVDAREQDTRIEQLEEQAKATLAQLTRQREDVDQQQQRLATLTQERYNLGGDTDPREARQQLEAQLTALRDTAQAARQQHTDTKAALDRAQQRHADLGTEIDTLRSQVAELSAGLQQDLSALNFPDLPTARAALLSADDLRALEEGLRELDRRSAEANRLEQDLQRALSRLEEQALTTDSLDVLTDQLTAVEASLREQQTQLGRLQEQWERDQRDRQQASDLMQRMEQQTAELQRWSRLAELIGQADGQKFRTFAQGLTLQRLVHLANVHLQQLHGRYRIYKREDADLELDIIDTYQADNQRSMNSLSGGESFLVSLALALGLSDLAGRDTQIHSLFIDEGFGTLDDKSLDLALTTLENLQASGKTIGVISHVKALKERIHVQIQLVRERGGNSRIQIVG